MDRALPKDATPLAAALAQLRAEVDRFPCEETLRAEIHAAGTLGGVSAAADSALRRTAGYGWTWWPRKSRLVTPLAYPPTAADVARRWAEQLASTARVAFARELAVVLAKTFPREVVIRIYLEVFWPLMP